MQTPPQTGTVLDRILEARLLEVEHRKKVLPETALSVLTEGEFFRGSLKNLRDARKNIRLPVLRKDFIFDPWQIWETRANDADSFLLIVAALRDKQLVDLIALGRDLGMEAVVEVHTAEELARAIAAGAKI